MGNLPMVSVDPDGELAFLSAGIGALLGGVQTYLHGGDNSQIIENTIRGAGLGLIGHGIGGLPSNSINNSISSYTTNSASDAISNQFINGFIKGFKENFKSGFWSSLIEQGDLKESVKSGLINGVTSGIVDGTTSAIQVQRIISKGRRIAGGLNDKSLTASISQDGGILNHGDATGLSSVVYDRQTLKVIKYDYVRGSGDLAYSLGEVSSNVQGGVYSTSDWHISRFSSPGRAASARSRTVRSTIPNLIARQRFERIVRVNPELAAQHRLGWEWIPETANFVLTGIASGYLGGVLNRGVSTFLARSTRTVLGTDAATLANAGRMVSEKGTHQLLVHGHFDNFIINGTITSPKTVARRILQNGFKSGTPIRCISCHTGAFSDGAAYQLSRYLKSPVLAPNNKVRILKSGSYEIYGNGIWKQF